MGISIEEDEVDLEFDNMDVDGSGIVSFEEFCMWCAAAPLYIFMVLCDALCIQQKSYTGRRTKL